MYNRYVPQPDGTYRKKQEAEHVSSDTVLSSPAAPIPIPEIRKADTESFSNGDLITLLSMLLIASEGDENRTTALLTLAFYFLA